MTSGDGRPDLQLSYQTFFLQSFFQVSLVSAWLLPLFLYLISILLFPCTRFGRTLMHEFYIFYCQSEWNMLFSFSWHWLCLTRDPRLDPWQADCVYQTVLANNLSGWCKVKTKSKQIFHYLWLIHPQTYSVFLLCSLSSQLLWLLISLLSSA